MITHAPMEKALVGLQLGVSDKHPVSPNYEIGICGYGHCLTASHGPQQSLQRKRHKSFNLQACGRTGRFGRTGWMFGIGSERIDRDRRSFECWRLDQRCRYWWR